MFLLCRLNRSGLYLLLTRLNPLSLLVPDLRLILLNRMILSDQFGLLFRLSPLNLLVPDFQLHLLLRSGLDFRKFRLNL